MSTATQAPATTQASATSHGNGNAHGHANGHANGHASTRATTSEATSSTHASSPANANGHAHVRTSTHANVQTSTQGVKPSYSTSHETHAAASSTQTKLYGNGKTAGQIVQQYGASPSTMLHGPGNSQPHKTGCGPHEVDVHALKAHAGAGCAANVKTHEKTQEHGKSNEHGNSGSNGNVSESGHVTICHATGSKSHPFVVISPASSGVFHGHMGHQVQEDVVPTFTFNGLTLSQNLTAQGQTMLNSGCSSASTETQSSTTTTSNAAVITLVVGLGLLAAAGLARFAASAPR